MNEDDLSSGTKHALAHSFDPHLRANFLSTSRGIWIVLILSLLSIAAKISVLGLIMSSFPYLRSALGGLPLADIASLVLNIQYTLVLDV